MGKHIKTPGSRHLKVRGAAELRQVNIRFCAEHLHSATPTEDFRTCEAAHNDLPCEIVDAVVTMTKPIRRGSFLDQVDPFLF